MEINLLLETGISIVFVYVLFAIIVSGINELIQTICRSRSYALHSALNEVFNDRLNRDFTGLLYTHPLIDTIKQSTKSYPAYIQSRIFADALIDYFSRQHLLNELQFNDQLKVYERTHVTQGDSSINAASTQLNRFIAGVSALNNSDLKILLTSFHANAANLQELRNNIIFWYDEYMNVVTSWYKRTIMKRGIITGIIVAVAFNVNSIRLATDLYEQDTLRKHVVEAASHYYDRKKSAYHTDSLADHNPARTMEEELKDIQEAYREVGVLKLPIGWDFSGVESKEQTCCSSKKKNIDGILTVLGWLISGLAFAFGADYWFNLLGKLINVRSVVKPKEGSGK